MHRLRGQPDVADHGNLGVNQGLDQARALFAAFDFHGLRARFLDEARRIAQRFPQADVVRRERHVRHQEGPFHPAAYGTGVMQHFAAW